MELLLLRRAGAAEVEGTKYCNVNAAKYLDDLFGECVVSDT